MAKCRPPKSEKTECAKKALKASDRAEIRREKQKAKYIAAMELTGRNDKSAKLAGVGVTTVFDWIKADAIFGDAVEIAKEKALQIFDDEAHRRAVDGVEEPVFFQGTECGMVRKYSDTLLIFLMKANNPKKYRDNTVSTLKIDASKVIDWNFGDADKDPEPSTEPSTISTNPIS
jgi:hypothetical protein